MSLLLHPRDPAACWAATRRRACLLTLTPLRSRACVLGRSALDLTNEAVMYEALSKIEGLTYLSVGHRPSLLRFHSQRLKLFGMESSPSSTVESVDEAAVEESLEASLVL